MRFKELVNLFKIPQWLRCRIQVQTHIGSGSSKSRPTRVIKSQRSRCGQVKPKFKYRTHLQTLSSKIRAGCDFNTGERQEEKVASSKQQDSLVGSMNTHKYLPVSLSKAWRTWGGPTVWVRRETEWLRVSAKVSVSLSSVLVCEGM